MPRHAGRLAGAEEGVRSVGVDLDLKLNLRLERQLDCSLVVTRGGFVKSCRLAERREPDNDSDSDDVPMPSDDGKLMGYRNLITAGC